MATPQRIVIVGASLAGASAAAGLRAEGYTGGIVLLGAEDERPYERPPLSKGFLAGTETDVPYVHEEGFYAEHDIDLRTGTTAAGLDVAAAEVALESGERIGYDAVVLATGSSPRALPVPGAEVTGIATLRTVEDSRKLRERITEAGRIVVIGAGWIGAEVSASARQLGAEVILVEPQEVPLQRVLGTTVGRIYADLHRAHGVDLRLEIGVAEFVGEERLVGVRLSDGVVVETPLALIGVGAVPRVELARDAGLELGEGGVLTDAKLRTSVPGIYAVGDIAAAWHPLYERHVRVEHWANAKEQGAHVARTVLGADDDYAKPPYFFSDQYDLGMEYRGLANVDAGADDDVVLRGDPAGGEFIAFWLRSGRVQAAMNANIWDAGDALEALVTARAEVDPAALADASVPLEDLAKG